MRLAAAFLVSLASAAQSDTLFLQDGRIYDGVTLARTGDSVVVGFANGKVTVHEDDILDWFVEYGPGLFPDTPEARERVEQGQVLFQGRWVQPKVRARQVEKLLEERREQAEEIKAARLWRNRHIEQTKNFHIESTVEPEIFETVRDRMEAYFQLFAKRWRVRRPRDLGPLKVRFYADRDAFKQVSGASGGTLAFFRFVEPLELQCYYDRLDPEGSVGSVYHEVAHYLQHLMNFGFTYSHWPGESLAEYFSSVRWDEKRKRMEHEPRVLEDRLISIKKDIEENDWVGLEELLTGCNARRYHDYTWGWSLVYFLMSQSDTSKDFEKFFLALARGRDVERDDYSVLSNRFTRVDGSETLRLFRKYMGLRKDEDFDDLEASWHDFVQNELQVVSGPGLARAAQQALFYGRKHRARRLFEESVATGETSALTHHRYAGVLDELEQFDEAWKNWSVATQLEPLVADYYIAWGESMVESAVEDEDEDDADEALLSARKSEGQRLLRLALEIEPDNLYLEAHLEDLLAR